MSAFETMLGAFDGFRRQVASSDRDWLTSLRDKAFRRFKEQGFPHRKLEPWRFTSVEPIAKTDFAAPVAVPAASIVGVTGIESAAVPNLAGPRLVFVNGRYAAELSDASGLPAGVRLTSLAEALRDGDEDLSGRLGRYADISASPFTALNTAYLADGAVLVLPSGAVLEHPVQLLFIARGGEQAVFSAPRVLVLAGAGSQGTLIESYAGQGVYWTNAVTEVVLDANAHLSHIKLQRESTAAFHTSHTQAHQAEDSVYTHHSLSFGGALVRNDINAYLGGENVEATLNGLFIVDGTRHVDHHTHVDHAKPHGRSDEKYRGILGDKSTGVFRGKIHVHPDAQKTDAYQNNRNLLLSPEAVVHTKPQLEIYADDVKCSHGATVGQLDDEAIFYLRSRGIGEADARRLLIYAFAGEIIGAVNVPELRDLLETAMPSLLPQGVTAPEFS